MEHFQHPIEAWGPDEPKDQIHIVGGGTIEHVRNHLALTAPAFGTAARQIAELAKTHMPDMGVNLHLTTLAGGNEGLTTSEDLRNLAARLIGNTATRVVIWSPAITDFVGKIGNVESGNHAERLSSAYPTSIALTPNEKILPMFRKDMHDGHAPRKDIFAVGFKTTTGATRQEQYKAGRKSLLQNELSLVLANDVVTRTNMLIGHEDAFYIETTDRAAALRGLIETVRYGISGKKLISRVG